MKNAIINAIVAFIAFLVISVLFISCANAQTLEERMKENTSKIIKHQTCSETALSRGVFYSAGTGAVILGTAGAIAIATSPITVPASVIAGSAAIYGVSGAFVGSTASLVTRISDDNFFNTNVLKQNCQIKYAKESVSKFGDAVSNMADAVGDAASKAGDVAAKTAEEMKSRIKNFF
jgi:hypothetical protein